MEIYKMEIYKIYSGTIQKVASGQSMKETFNIDIPIEWKDNELIKDIVKKYNGKIEDLFIGKCYRFSSNSDAQDFLNSEELLPYLIMRKLVVE